MSATDICEECGKTIAECNARALARLEYAKMVRDLASESDQQMRLRAGEMTAQELRTARSFLLLASTAIRRDGDISPPIRVRPRPE